MLDIKAKILFALQSNTNKLSNASLEGNIVPSAKVPITLPEVLRFHGLLNSCLRDLELPRAGSFIEVSSA